MNTTPPPLPGSQWTVAAEPVDGPDAVVLLRAYYTDIVDRFHRLHGGRAATAADVDAAMAAEPSGHLAPPGGVFLVARGPDGPAGCAGVHLLEAGTAELARVYVAPRARRGGLGGRLLAAAERAAAGTLRAGRLRLDTRDDLVEAQAMYRRHGYAEIPAYHDLPYADRFFEKRLTS